MLGVSNVNAFWKNPVQGAGVKGGCMVSKFLIIIAVVSFATVTAFADTIYKWTDKNGVQKFSNEPPPETVVDYEIHQTPTSGSIKTDSQNRRRTFDRMTENASEEADQLERERKMKAASQEAQKKSIEKENRKKRIQAERHRLEYKIDALKKRGLSPTFSKGMRQSQIEKLEREIQKLETEK